MANFLNISLGFAVKKDTVASVVNSTTVIKDSIVSLGPVFKTVEKHNLIGALFEPEKNTWQIMELLPAAKVTAELDNFIAEGGFPKTLDYTNIEDSASAS